LILTGRAKVAGVLGWPVGHSLSPALHGYWLRHYGIDGAYVPLAVRPADLGLALRALPKLGFAGANVTVPHKEAALSAIDETAPEALRLGAINTIVVGGDGALRGTNTDGFGFIENLRTQAPSWRADAGPAVLIGAGGAAKAVAAALVDQGVPEVRIANRTADRALRLAAGMSGPFQVVAWQDLAEALRDAALVVNATTLGMQGQPPLQVALDPLPRQAVVCDLVYVPLLTPLLVAARARGNPIVDGLGMLMHQARPGFAAWFGTAPEVTAELRTHLLARLG
jgi:shikimate dehydrogenase